MSETSEHAERKAWNAHVHEAAEFYRGAGEEAMSAEDRAVYKEMVLAVENAAARLAATRGKQRDD